MPSFLGNYWRMCSSKRTIKYKEEIREKEIGEPSQEEGKKAHLRWW